ncbi:rRNA N6-adenosine-methyltransferase ZCCHC4-like [Ornithodoros turicata]|uniref:rRNA N6-adenosine-methyltransferase ZCCHC4-like n=1 Tax=Ornithodoros turicata TaxID=34597 RepID=UPI00313A2BD3
MPRGCVFLTSDITNMSRSTNAVELIRDSTAIPPCCEHGPALLFRRIGTESKNDGRSFYACSASRDRKKCRMFLWEDEASRSLNSKTWETVSRRVLPEASHPKLYKRYLALSRYPASQRIFCCQKLILQSEMKQHKSHSARVQITDAALRRPSHIINVDTSNTTKAQYFFRHDCVRFVTDLLRSRKYRHVVCIGTPTIHEHLREHCDDVDSLLLDIEQAYECFYSEDEFCWYNMFNHFFFRGSRAETALNRRLQEATSCAVLVDPPFGGRIDAIAFTLEKIRATARDPSALNIFLFFPYFNEKQICENMPTLRMLDYKVDYENHADFNETRAKGSPVRIFTDVPLSCIPLPSESYRYCEKCTRWVAMCNRHCDICGDCTAKDGGQYKHCNSCGSCVKQSHKHCDTCGSCRPEQHNCTASVLECFRCKKRGHKSKQCPEKSEGTPEMKKKKKQ